MKVALFFVFASISASNCFKSLKSRLPRDTVRTLDKVLSYRCRITKLQHRLSFLKDCANLALIPEYIRQRIEHSKLQLCADTCSKYLQWETSKVESDISSLTSKLADLKPTVYSLPLYSFCKFVKFTSSVVKNLKSDLNSKAEFDLEKSTPWNVGFYPNPIDKHICNLSSYELSLTEKQALSRGLKFCVPRSQPQPNIDAEFENFFQQTTDLVPNSEHIPQLKAELVSLSRNFSDKHRFNSPLSKKHLEALNNLRKNEDVVVCKPDKGNSVVVLNKADYVSKLELILNNPDKFTIDEYQIDLTEKVEKQVSQAVYLISLN